ncbi:hypothetical protein BDD12DRAFT_388201 [Trichophaea hybrida]|nr:hypothetical protein BDD12DRAFT_388201 [Trichophaea hybrida]
MSDMTHAAIAVSVSRSPNINTSKTVRCITLRDLTAMGMHSKRSITYFLSTCFVNNTRTQNETLSSRNRRRTGWLNGFLGWQLLTELQKLQMLLNQCSQPSCLSVIAQDGDGRQEAVRPRAGRKRRRLFEAGRRRTERNAVDGEVLVHITKIIRNSDRDARSASICSIHTMSDSVFPTIKPSAPRIS